jgi:hypothetical protein
MSTELHSRMIPTGTPTHDAAPRISTVAVPRMHVTTAATADDRETADTDGIR